MILYCFHQKHSGLILILSLLNAYLVQSNSTTNQCSNYCSKGGICLRTENGPKCICSPKWTGERCEIAQQLNTSQTNITESRNDPCTYAPDNFCQNGGICYVKDDLFACHCRYPYGGDNCERFSICYNYCFYGGVCTEENDAATCKCSEDRTGTRCETLITTTTGSTTTTTTESTTTTTAVQCAFLKCGPGTCVLENTKVKCICPPTHTGVQCQTPSGATPTPGSSTVFPPTSGGPTIFPPTSGGPTVFPPTSGGPTVFPPASSTSEGQRITCANAPCRNGAKCYNNGNTYFCLCDARFTGKDCENSA